MVWPPASSSAGLCASAVFLPGARVEDAALVEVGHGLEDPGPPGVADVVVGQRHPVDPGLTQPVDVGGIGGEHEPVIVEPEAVGRRVLEVGDGDVGAAHEVADDAGVAGSLRIRQVPAERRAVLAVAGDRHGAAVEREVRTALAVADGEGDAAIEQDVATGEQRPRGRRVVGGRGTRRRAQLHDEGPGIDRLDPADPEHRRAIPGQGADRGGHLVGAQEPELRPGLGHAGRQRLGVRDDHQVLAQRRPLHAEGCQDRIRIAVDQHQRRVGTGARRDRADVRARDPGGGRPEAGDRHDRNPRRGRRRDRGRLRAGGGGRRRRRGFARLRRSGRGGRGRRPGERTRRVG